MGNINKVSEAESISLNFIKKAERSERIATKYIEQGKPQRSIDFHNDAALYFRESAAYFKTKQISSK